MIARSVLAALVAGILAGIVIAAVHHIKLSPMIAAAKVFEHQDRPGHAAETQAADSASTASDTQPAGHDHDHDEGWTPAEGFERIAATTVSWALTGAGFALLLAAVSNLSGIPITSSNALAWGVGGFLAASLSPAAGLAPELPGMPAAELASRQVWWTFTVAATAGGLLILAKRSAWPWIALATVLILLPHIIGAPQPASEESNVPAALAASFVGATLAVSALFWLLLAAALARMLPPLDGRSGEPA